MQRGTAWHVQHLYKKKPMTNKTEMKLKQQKNKQQIREMHSTA